jgi:hypothetical protein
MRSDGIITQDLIRFSMASLIAPGVAQISEIASILGTPGRPMSEKTRALYEYAQSVINSKAAGDFHGR